MSRFIAKKFSSSLWMVAAKAIDEQSSNAIQGRMFKLNSTELSTMKRSAIPAVGGGRSLSVDAVRELNFGRMNSGRRTAAPTFATIFNMFVMNNKSGDGDDKKDVNGIGDGEINKVAPGENKTEKSIGAISSENKQAPAEVEYESSFGSVGEDDDKICTGGGENPEEVKKTVKKETQAEIENEEAPTGDRADENNDAPEEVKTVKKETQAEIENEEATDGDRAGEIKDAMEEIKTVKKETQVEIENEEAPTRDRAGEAPTGENDENKDRFRRGSAGWREEG